jgi:hypothetical protein
MPRKKKHRVKKFFQKWWGGSGSDWYQEREHLYKLPVHYVPRDLNVYLVTELNQYHWLFDRWCGYRFYTYTSNSADRKTAGRQKKPTIRRELDWYRSDKNPLDVMQQDALLTVLYDKNFVWNMEATKNLSVEDKQRFRNFIESMKLGRYLPLTNGSVKTSRMMFEFIIDELTKAMNEGKDQPTPEQMARILGGSGNMPGKGYDANHGTLEGLTNKMDTIMLNVSKSMEKNTETQMKAIQDAGQNQPTQEELDSDKATSHGISNSGVNFYGETWKQYEALKDNVRHEAEIQLNHICSDIVGFTYKDGDLSGAKDASIMDGIDGEILEIISPEHILMDILPLLELEVPSNSDKMVDIYLDYSGSMSEHVTLRTADGQTVRVSKAVMMLFALKMLQDKHIVRNVYPFSGRVVDMEDVNKGRATELKWYHADPSGGTDLTACYVHFAARGHFPSVMITDGGGRIEYYHENFNIILIGQDDYMDTMNPETAPAYRHRGQMLQIFAEEKERLMNQTRMHEAHFF